MSQEIIYTSAPAGLKPGSRGFCTVAATRGIAKPLADQLEDLSGYRHLAAGGDGPSAANPIVYSHLKLSIAGRIYHVLSRICDAGLDYSRRTNKLAHHVALEPAELVPAGPAAILATPGFMATSWSGEPAVRDFGPRVPSADAAPGVCNAWAQLAGDAGWGGAVAEALAGDARRQVVLVYRAGADVLRLVAETLALLPPAKRWEATFCTYFTKLPPTVDCRWRCVVDGTPEAVAAARAPGALVIDLRRPLGALSESPYVEAARTGRPLPAPPTAIPAVSQATLSRTPDADDLLLEALGEETRDIRKRGTASPREAASPTYGLAPPPIARPYWEAELVPGSPEPRPKQHQSRKTLLAVVVTASVSVLAVAGYHFGTGQFASDNAIVHAPKAKAATTPAEETASRPVPTATAKASDPPLTPNMLSNENKYQVLEGQKWQTEIFRAPQSRPNGLNLRLAGEDANHFAIADTSIKAKGPFDYENPQDANRDNHYDVDLVVTASDNSSLTHSLQIAVENINDTPPRFVAPVAKRIAYVGDMVSLRLEAEDADRDAVEWTMDADGAPFALSNGELKSIKSLDKSGASYSCAVTLSDGKHRTTHTIEITVQDWIKVDPASFEISGHHALSPLVAHQQAQVCAIECPNAEELALELLTPADRKNLVIPKETSPMVISAAGKGPYGDAKIQLAEFKLVGHAIQYHPYSALGNNADVQQLLNFSYLSLSRRGTPTSRKLVALRKQARVDAVSIRDRMTSANPHTLEPSIPWPKGARLKFANCELVVGKSSNSQTYDEASSSFRCEFITGEDSPSLTVIAPAPFVANDTGAITFAPAKIAISSDEKLQNILRQDLRLGAEFSFDQLKSAYEARCLEATLAPLRMELGNLDKWLRENPNVNGKVRDDALSRKKTIREQSDLRIELTLQPWRDFLDRMLVKKEFDATLDFDIVVDVQDVALPFLTTRKMTN